MRDQYRIFMKSGNTVRLIDQISEDEWEVERVSGSSQGKRMICRTSSLSPIDEVIGSFTEIPGTEEHDDAVMEFVKIQRWPVTIMVQTDGGYDLNVLYSAHKLANMPTLDSAQKFCRSNHLVMAS